MLIYRIILLVLLAIALAILAPMVKAHDIYSNLYSSGTPGVGQWCCNGDAERGDCEAVGSSYRVLDNGDVVLQTRRYGKREVRVAKDKVTWLPVPGGEHSEAHWCGKPRSGFVPPNMTINAEQIDPETWTYCAFIAPGGV